MRSAYASWISQAVVLQVAAAGLRRAPVRGIIVSESESALRIRTGKDWDVDISKSMILAVEEDACANISPKTQQTRSARGKKAGVCAEYRR
jgi:hypothetical protein